MIYSLAEGAEVLKIVLQYYFGLFLLLFYCPLVLKWPNNTIAIVKILFNTIATIAHCGKYDELNLKNTTEKNLSIFYIILSSIGSNELCFVLLKTSEFAADAYHGRRCA